MIRRPHFREGRLLTLSGLAALGATLLTTASLSAAPLAPTTAPTTATVTILDPAGTRLVAPTAQVEKLGSGFSWVEGPLWVSRGHYLLFSDVLKNRIHRWSRQKGMELFLEPAGGAGKLNGFREVGSNGLKPGAPGFLLMADQGNRGIAELNLTTRHKRLIVDRFQGKRFNRRNAQEARVDFVLGEFYWKVEAGEKVWAEDYERARDLISQERSGTEVNWSHGIPVPARLIADAFGYRPKESNYGTRPSASGPSTIVVLVVILIAIFVLVSVADSCSSCGSSAGGGGMYVPSGGLRGAGGGGGGFGGK